MNGQWVSGDLAHSLDGKLNILGFVEEEGKVGFTGAHRIDPLLRRPVHWLPRQERQGDL